MEHVSSLDSFQTSRQVKPSNGVWIETPIKTSLKFRTVGFRCEIWSIQFPSQLTKDMFNLSMSISHIKNESVPLDLVNLHNLNLGPNKGNSYQTFTIDMPMT